MKVVTKKFNFSYAVLEQLGDEADGLMERDAAELLLYGVDGDVRTEIAELTQDLKDFPTDEELRGDVTDTTAAKDAAASSMKVKIRGIMVRADAALGENSGKFRSFGTKGMDDMDDSDLVRCGRRVVRKATQHLALLAPKGVNVAMIGELNTNVLLLDDNIDLKGDAVHARDNATEDRAILGNKLYDKIEEVYGFGKSHWVNLSESNYNDYVIYDTPTGTPLPPEGTTDLRAHVTRQDTGQQMGGLVVTINPGVFNLLTNNSGLTEVVNIEGNTCTVAVNGVPGFQPYSVTHPLSGGNVVFEVVLVPIPNP